MCGIVGAISERKISRILLEGLKRLEYRGYDSAGIALLSEGSDKLQQLRSVGKVRKLSDTTNLKPFVVKIRDDNAAKPPKKKKSKKTKK